MQLSIKVLHIITRMDRGGSAQNTLLTCHELSQKYAFVLAQGLSIESTKYGVRALIFNLFLIWFPRH